MSEAKEPPAPRIEPGAVQTVARVHAPHHAPARTISKINCLDRYDQVFFDLFHVNIQLAHLQTLAAVARHGSFSRAARELRLTQPAVSMQVRQLEQELGLALLERVGKRTYTTKAGELLLAHAGRAMRELERGLELVGVERESAFKLGRWHDVTIVQRRLDSR